MKEIEDLNLKICVLNNCDMNHEGCCIIDDVDFICNAKTDEDLITKEEFEKHSGVK